MVQQNSPNGRIRAPGKSSAPRARAVCTCASCADRSHSGWLKLLALRAKSESRGRPLPPVSRDTYRGGLGSECEDCAGAGRPMCADCSGTGEGRNEYTRCSSCRGTGEAGACERCSGEGRLDAARCDRCGHLVETAELHTDARLAAECGWTGMAWVCGDCSDCERCGTPVHPDVADADGLCLECQLTPRALLPERAAALLKDERGLETVEWAVVAGLIVVGVIVFVVFVGGWAARHWSRLKGETVGEAH